MTSIRDYSYWLVQKYRENDHFGVVPATALDSGLLWRYIYIITTFVFLLQNSVPFVSLNFFDENIKKWTTYKVSYFAKEQTSWNLYNGKIYTVGYKLE